MSPNQINVSRVTGGINEVSAVSSARPGSSKSLAGPGAAALGLPL